MKLTYIKQAGEPNGDAGDQYTGLDRFGRVVDQRWPQGSTELERVKYGFTPASNRQWRQNLVAAGGQDQYYNYDGLYQVKAAKQGTLNSTKTGIAGTPARTEDFTYDPIGNWNNYLTKVSGVPNLDQSRTHNTANQTTAIDGSTATVAHDPAGNMTTVPQVTDWASTNELKWDAWNRLVKVQDGSTPVAEYAYDGLTRRTKKTVGGTTRRYFYSDQWQILEERLNAATTADRQFVWGQRFTDDLVLRIRGSERLYVLSDYFNPTAIADEAGTVLERYGYDTFGLSRVMTPSFAPRTSSNYDWETRFHAYRYDAETGLYQVRYRYLHPALGRWLSRDPLVDAAFLASFSRGKSYRARSHLAAEALKPPYQFVSNDPISRTDALGLFNQSATPFYVLSRNIHYDPATDDWWVWIAGNVLGLNHAEMNAGSANDAGIPVVSRSSSLAKYEDVRFYEVFIEHNPNRKLDDGSGCECAHIGNVSECLKRHPHGCVVGGNCQEQVMEQLKKCCLISQWYLDPYAYTPPPGAGDTGGIPPGR